MSNFVFEKMHISDLLLITPLFYEDERGFFQKNYEKEIFQNAGIGEDIFEQFESLSYKNVIRGLHFQRQKPQAKIVRVIFGEIFDVAVDLRRKSRTFGKWEAVRLSGENRKSFYIPAGFAHGFMVLSNKALISYMCAGKYYKEYDTGIRWDDSDIGIEWPLELVGGKENIILSERDKKHQTFTMFLEQFSCL